MKFLLFFLLSTSTPAKEDQGSLIAWKADRKLTWSDFKARPVAGATNAALTSSNINFNFSYGTKGFTYSISCNFDKNKSWVRVKTDYILAHEQAHFDIAEIHARKLNMRLSQYKYNEKTVGTDLDKIYNEVMKEQHQLQLLYDKETNHSLNSKKQKEWLKKISDLLASLSPFANYKQPGS